jgi:mono/diheme cytochrome c family protein
MLRISVRLAFLTASVIALPAFAAMANDPQITRGKYLVTLGGCNDCHTPGYFFGNPDMSRFLGGSDVGFEIPGQVSLWAATLHPTKKPASVVGPQSRS